MRLNCALVSSLLSVPIVLADYYPEKHQPRFLNKKNINAILPLPPWAGAHLLQGNEACRFCTGGYTANHGTFAVPRAWDGNSTGVAIMVGIGNLCADRDGAFSVGIEASLTNNVVSYKGIFLWGTQRAETSSDFKIDTGHFIRASVKLDSGMNGFALLENHYNGQIWEQYFAAVHHGPACQLSAEWMVLALDNYPTNVVPVPKFSTVTFVNATVETAHGASATLLSGGASFTNMKDNNGTTLISGMADENTVVVTCEMY